MQLITSDIENTIKANVFIDDVNKSSENISELLDELYTSIPDNKRISYGRVFTINLNIR